MHDSALRVFLKPRSKTAHKGSFGHVFTLGGSKGKIGAGVLSAYAALQAGAGLSTLVLPESCYQKINPKTLELMYEPVADQKKGFFSEKNLKEVLTLLKKASVVAIGPGIGTEPATVRFVHGILKKYQGPLVIDADALNCLSINLESLSGRSALTLLTPHVGEMSRLIRKSIKYVQDNRTEVARKFATKYQITLLLKGHRSVVASPDGSIFINPTGNPAMANAGQGDTLTGIYAGLLAQYPNNPKVFKFGCFLHGLVGDLLAKEGRRVVLASQIAANLHLGYEHLKSSEKSLRISSF